MTTLSPEEYQLQMDQINKVHQAAKKEAWLLDQFYEERKRTLSSLVGSTWMAKTFPDRPSELDPLLARKFRTKAGYASIRLDKLLLDLDNVQSMGDERIRDRRREEVKYLQSLLKRADALNAKTNRLVDFQEKLAKLGKETLLTSFEPNKADRMASDDASSDGRRFASKSRRNNRQEQQKMEVEEEEEENTSGSDSDSETSENPAERYYREMMGYKPQPKKKTSRKVEKRVRRQAAPETASSDDEDMRQLHRPSKAAAQYRASQAQPAREQDLVEPQYTIEEMPRSYVITIQDPHVRYAKVGIDEEGVLIVAVPEKAPLKYSLGSNINAQGITKEVQGPYMKLVLPKKPERRQVNRWPTGYADHLSPLGSRRGEADFWSRF